MRTLLFLGLAIFSLKVSGQEADSIGFFSNSHASDTLLSSGENQKEAKDKSSSYGLPEINFEIGPTQSRINIEARVQSRYDYNITDDKGDLMFRRIRIKSDGYLFTKRLKYKFETDFVEPIGILDAVLKYSITDNFSIKAGQTKLSGNRERVISSQNLQFVDRSLLNSNFNIDRDIGIWLHHDNKIGEVLIRKSFSVTQGDGLTLFKDNDRPLKEGLDYTGRIEFLPFGEFENKGDYTGPDLARQETPKLSIGISYDYNNNTTKSRGQRGEFTSKTADLKSLFVDAIFKYRGWSYLGEFANKNASDVTFLPEYDTEEPVLFVTGYAVNNQAGYVFKNNFEMAFRYTIVRPEEETGLNDLNEYTFALSKYIIGHKIKVQSDISLREEEGEDENYIFRIQLELAI